MNMHIMSLAFVSALVQGGPIPSAAAEDTPQVAVQEPAPTAPTLRLPRAFLPTAYAARLVVSPAETTFRGHIDIDAQLTEATRVIWLNGRT